MLLRHVRAVPVLILLFESVGLANPVPLINQPLVPASAVPGGAGFTLTVNGTGFVSGSVVNWNGSPRATTFVSGSQLTATILSPDIATPETASVTVSSPAPGGGISNVAYFEVTMPTASVSFVTTTGGYGGYGTVAGDFNGDGIADLATAGGNSETVYIQLGNGDGTFQPPITIPTGDRTYPNFLAAGDFNRDGKLDLAVLELGTYGVLVLLGKGDGTFQTGVTVPLAPGYSIYSASVGDFNGDGNLDLAVVGDELSILVGNGDGTFQTPVSYPAGYPQSVAVGDFNGDGKPDLAFANSSLNAISILIGNGDGTFQPPVNYPTGSAPSGITAADFNGDGRLDLAVANYGATSGDSVSVLLGNGDGTFQTAQNYAVGYGPTAIISGDFNGDGNLDLAVVNSVSSTVSILFGNGNGTFQAQTAYSCECYLYFPIIAAADFNRDGRLDLATNSSVLLQAPAVTLNPTSLAFGNQNVGTTSPSQSVTLTNTGSLSFTISAVSITGTNPADFSQTNNCLVTLAPGSTCTITVTFDPTTSGARSASVSITDNAPGSPQTIALNGTGIAAAVSLSATSLTFAAQLVGTTSSPQVVTLTNTGNGPLTVSSITATGAFSQTNNCTSSIAPGASCSIGIVFSPTTTGSLTGAVSISDNAPGSPQTIALTGTGVAPAVRLSTTSLTFATQLVGTSSNPQAVTLTNTGNGPLIVSSIVSSGAFSQTNNCTPSVAAGGNCTVNAVFSPTAKGTLTGTVSITDNAPGSPQSISLTGTGTVVSLSTNKLKFGKETVGKTSAPKTVTLKNTGSTSLTESFTITGTDPGDFAYTTTCPKSLSAGKSCAINVTFTPKAKGARSATLAITDNGGGSPQKVALAGSGT